MTIEVSSPASAREVQEAIDALAKLTDAILIQGVLLDLRPGLPGSWAARAIRLHPLPDRVGFGWDHFPGGARESVELFPGDQVLVGEARMEKADSALPKLDGQRATARVHIKRAGRTEDHPTPIIFVSPEMIEVGGIVADEITVDFIAARLFERDAPDDLLAKGAPAASGFLERHLAELAGPNDPKSVARRRLGTLKHRMEVLSEAITQGDFERLSQSALYAALDEAAGFGYSAALAGAEESVRPAWRSYAQKQAEAQAKAAAARAEWWRPTARGLAERHKPRVRCMSKLVDAVLHNWPESVKRPTTQRAGHNHPSPTQLTEYLNQLIATGTLEPFSQTKNRRISRN